MLNPSETAAVVGGNVLTSQRIVDVVLKAFQVCAASQVTQSKGREGKEDVEERQAGQEREEKEDI